MADIVVTADKVGEAFPHATEVFSVKLAEAVTRGQILYQTATGAFGIADANDAGKEQARGVALEGGGAGQVIRMLKRGVVEGFTVSGLNCDAPLYLSNTAGALADGAGAMTVICGRVYGHTDGTKLIHFDFDWLRAWS